MGEVNSSVPNADDTYFQLSPQAVIGHFSPKTLKFTGLLNGLTITVLIDTDSTHNILQPLIAQHLKIPTKPIPNFSVMVGNDSKLSCTRLCPQVPITLQNNLFLIHFHLLPLEGADVVLGMKWLRTLGPITVDFYIPKISFTYQNNAITITGDPKSLPTHSTYNKFCYLLHTDSIASIHLLLYQPSNENHTIQQKPDPNSLDSLPPSLSNQITPVLKSHVAVFKQPHGLPPSRLQDHHIPIIPNTSIINVKPYHYPHSQKETMTTIIQYML